MELDLGKINELLKNKKAKPVIEKAISHQLRLRFHSEAYLDKLSSNRAVTLFLNWVATLIPKDKYIIFCNLFRFPISNIELTEKIYKELERIFESRNSNFSYNFNDTKWRDDWEDYRQEILKEPIVWKEVGWQKMKTSINSVLVVDVRPEGIDNLPNPYFFWLDIEHVLDFLTDEEGKMEYIIFSQPNDEVVVYDSVYWRKFDYKDEILTIKKEEIHGLDYCPAQFFWTDNINSHSKDIKQSPLTAQLANLDWLQFFDTSNRHLNLYANYPIMVTTESECDYENIESGEHCKNGFLANLSGDYIFTETNQLKPCPVCASANKLSGVGSVVTKPMPKKDEKELTKPIEFVTLSRDLLDYNNETSESLANKIFRAVTGLGGSVIESQAVNEKQIQGTFESKTNILISLKSNFEKAQKFVDDTICRLRYRDAFVSSNINYGTSFYIYSMNELQEQYKSAKESGADNARLDALYEQIVELENKNNPKQRQRMLILKQLEPYRHKTIEELMAIEGKFPELIDKELVKIKLNFNSYVDRFEREQETNITEYGINDKFDTKINYILNEFRNYGKTNE